VVCVCDIVFPSVLFPVVCERVNFGSLEIIKLRIRYWIYFVFLYCSVSVLERTYAEKWTVEKKVYIHYMLQAREVMHIIGGPLQRSAVLTFSSCW